jgi:hypothetical protein
MAADAGGDGVSIPINPLLPDELGEDLRIVQKASVAERQ